MSIPFSVLKFIRSGELASGITLSSEALPDSNVNIQTPDEYGNSNRNLIRLLRNDLALQDSIDAMTETVAGLITGLETSLVPIGVSLPFSIDQLPSDSWVFANGQLLDITAYPEYYSKVGTKYGSDATVVWDGGGLGSYSTTSDNYSYTGSGGVSGEVISWKTSEGVSYNRSLWMSLSSASTISGNGAGVAYEDMTLIQGLFILLQAAPGTHYSRTSSITVPSGKTANVAITTSPGGETSTIVFNGVTYGTGGSVQSGSVTVSSGTYSISAVASSQGIGAPVAQISVSYVDTGIQVEATKFRVPDLRRKYIIGSGGTKLWEANTSNGQSETEEVGTSLGDVGGTESHSLLKQELPDDVQVELPLGVALKTAPYGTGAASVPQSEGQSDSGGSWLSKTNVLESVNNPLSKMPPTIVQHFIIKVK